MEMSRQRLRPGMIEATTQPCPHCHGTGLLRSDDNLALSIIRQLEEEGVRGRSKEVLVKAPVAIANYLINEKRDHILQIEARYGLSVRIEADFSLISPDFSIEKFKTATRKVTQVASNVVSVDPSMMDDYVDAPEDAEDNLPAAETTAAPEVPEPEEGAAPKKKRRRRRRRRSSSSTHTGAEGQSTEGQDANASEEGAVATPASDPEVQDAPVEASTSTEAVTEAATAKAETPAESAEDAPAPKPKRTRTRSSSKSKAATVSAEAAVVAPADVAETPVEVAETPATEEGADAPAPKKTSSRAKSTTAKSTTAKATATKKTTTKTTATKSTTAKPKATAKPKTSTKAKEDTELAPVVEAVSDVAIAPEPAPAPKHEPVAEAAPEAKTDEPAKPKRRGWWSLGK